MFFQKFYGAQTNGALVIELHSVTVKNTVLAELQDERWTETRDEQNLLCVRTFSLCNCKPRKPGS